MHNVPLLGCRPEEWRESVLASETGDVCVSEKFDDATYSALLVRQDKQQIRNIVQEALQEVRGREIRVYSIFRDEVGSSILEYAGRLFVSLHSLILVLAVLDMLFRKIDDPATSLVPECYSFLEF